MRVFVRVCVFACECVFFEGVLRVFGGCLQGVLRAFEGVCGGARAAFGGKGIDHDCDDIPDAAMAAALTALCAEVRAFWV